MFPHADGSSPTSTRILARLTVLNSDVCSTCVIIRSDNLMFMLPRKIIYKAANLKIMSLLVPYRSEILIFVLFSRKIIYKAANVKIMSLLVPYTH